MASDAEQSPLENAERLREVVLDLEKAKEIEKQLREEATALLDGLRALTEAKNPHELQQRLFAALRTPLGFDCALVLHPEGDRLCVQAATDENWVGTSIPVGKTLTRVLGGRLVTLFDTSAVTDFTSLPIDAQQKINSAICVPLRGDVQKAVLILGKEIKNSFTPRHEQLAKKFQPLVNQALRDAERSALIATQNRDMRVVLNNIAQGIVTVDRDGIIVGERSAAIEAWIGIPAPKTTLSTFLAKLESRVAPWLDMAWSQIVDGFLPIDLLLDQLPQRIKTSNHVFRVEWRPMPQAEAWTHMLVVLTDITAEVAREQADAQQKEFAALVARLMRDKAGVVSFLAEADALLATATQTDDEILKMRALHTLKGNTAIVGLHTVSQLCHAAESVLHEGGSDVDLGQSLQELQTYWSHFVGDIKGLLPSNNKRTYEVPADEFDFLVAELARQAHNAALAQALSRWRGVPVQNLLQRLVENTQHLAQRLGKGQTHVVCECEDIRLDDAIWQSFFASLVHTVRNSLDHGIEESEERVAVGKPAHGEIKFRAYQNEYFYLEITDDGRGINWQKIAEKAKEQGLPSDTRQDLIHALFADGISTRDEVTEISGRGVGMSVLQESVERLHGRIEIYSIPEQGTTLRFIFPQQDVAIQNWQADNDEENAIAA